MPRYYLLITGGLSAMLLASCTGSAVEEAAAPAPAEEVVVTGYKANGTASEQRARTADMAQYASAPEPVSAPAPPLPPAMAVTGKMAARAFAPSDQRRLPGYYQDVGRDKFTTVAENSFKVAREEPVSTFSIDVDTASYSFVRASLTGNVLPQPAAVRTEEMINYFPYDYAGARSADQPFSTNVAVFPSPWTEGRKLVRIGIRGYEIQRATRPRANLVFLIDTSGSMNAPNRLPLVKQSLSMLLDQLSGDDRVAIVTYAGSAGTELEPTPASQKGKILAALDRLGAGGSTAGAEGIRQAYALAEQNLDPQGVNRVILATDGDFNVGITNQEELKGFVERERGKGVFLSVLGFGMGNYNDALMQTLAQNGNGAAAYIDTVSEARKTLVDEATSTLFPIAKDVKIQVEFNPATVAEYRLIGYETRMLAREDFDNDKVDAGDVGSGQTVTALYEVVPVGGPRAIGDLRYSTPAPQRQAGLGSEYGFVKIRYKTPKANTSRLISTPINRAVEVARFEDAPRDARFATGVAGFAELLRGGKYSGTMSYDDVLRIALAARGDDGFGYRSEFVQLVRQAKTAASLARLGR
jgi:Ca-activated chloride channel family protein